MLDKIKALLAALGRHQLLVGGIVVVLLYAWFISSLSTHPAGSYVDESCDSYNAYLIAKTGTAENGVKFPLFFQCYTQGYTQWMSPLYIYMLAGVYLIVPPSVLSSRIFSATLVFVASLLLGFLAYRISSRRLIGAIVTVTAIATPWLFEISRLAFDPPSLAFAAALYLFCLYNAVRREKWKLADNFLVAISLAFVTYSYASGRLLGPLFAFGLLFFAVSWRALVDILKTWVIYSITMIPFLIVYFSNPLAISGRFAMATNLDASKSYLANAGTVVMALISDLSPYFLIIDGDYHPRHHIPGTGQFLVGTFALALLGIVLIVFRHRGSPWWRYILFASIVCLLPGAVTFERYHALRDIAFPVFFMVLTVPALSWLLEDKKNAVKTEPGRTGYLNRLKNIRFSHRALLYGLLAVTAIQTVIFQVQFLELGDNRPLDFNEAYPRVLDKALADGSRPIYLEDGAEPAYINGLWHGATKGIDRSEFVHLLSNEPAPNGAIVISSRDSCKQCEVLNKDGTFMLYRSLRPNSDPTRAGQLNINAGNAPGQFSRPYAFTVGADGSRYVTDRGTIRVQKFDADGKFVSLFGTHGSEPGEFLQPHGIAVNKAGDIYVTDASRHKLLKFKPDGTFVKEWGGNDVPFYGPRDMVFGSNGELYIVDQGVGRVVRFNTASEEFFTWGIEGADEGQFRQATGIAVGGEFVFVTDTGNNRVQVFDLNGKFLRQWAVPQWEKDEQHYPDITYDLGTKLVYVSSGKSNEVLVYGIGGGFIELVKPEEPVELDSPSSLFISSGPKSSRLLVLNSGQNSPGIIAIEIKK